jgi:hypothetical protein
MDGKSIKTQPAVRSSSSSVEFVNLLCFLFLEKAKKKKKIFVTFVFPSFHPFLLAFLFLVGCSFRHHKIKIKIGRNHVQLAMIYSELFLSVFPFFFFTTIFIARARKQNKTPPKNAHPIG